MAVIKLIRHNFIRELFRFYIRLKLFFCKITISQRGVIKLSYAGMLPKGSNFSYGGRIKLIHLSKVYPEQKRKFNILYLTSSAQPRGMEEWMRVSKKAGVRLVWNQNGVGFPAWAGKDYEKINRPMRQALNMADWVIYQSEFCKLSSDRFLGEFKSPYSIIYNCVDTDYFTPCLTPSSTRPLKLLTAGSQHSPYRVLEAIEAVAILRRMKIDAKLNIAGRLRWYGAKKEILRKINLSGLSGHVSVTDAYSQEKAPWLYRQAHILLHLQYKDCCPVVLIEAMACGIPVVCSMSGGVPELIGSEGGIALDVPENWENIYTPEPEAVANAVVRIMENWSEWSRMARNWAVLKFSRTKWLEEHRKIFHQLVA